MEQNMYRRNSTNLDSEDNSSDIIKCAEKFLEENRTKNISSADICKTLACSRSYISHKFKKQTGMSIREYIRKLRINDAKHLLEYSEMSVTDIAVKVGFEYSNYFTKVFKKEIGMAPATYRKQMRESK